MNGALSGEVNGRSKLNWKQVDRIRKVYRKGVPYKANPVSIFNLALKYDVAQFTIWAVVKNKSWIKKEAPNLS